MEIYAIKNDYRIDERSCNVLIKYLSEEEKYKVNRFLRWQDAQGTLIGKILIRSLIRHRYGFKNENIYFDKNKFGKPYFKYVNDFHFNISHSGQWVVCITDNHRVGIDIEEINNIDLNIAKNFFFKKEYEDVMKLDKQSMLDYFYDLWTLKESYIKAEGRGLSILLNSFYIKKERNNISLKGVKKDYCLRQYEISENYKLSVCATNNKFPTNINIMELKQFIDYSIDFLGGNYYE